MGVRADMTVLLKTHGELKTWKALKYNAQFTAMSLEHTYKSLEHTYMSIERNREKNDIYEFLLQTAADTLKP
jgi:hypothetical protein